MQAKAASVLASRDSGLRWILSLRPSPGGEVNRRRAGRGGVGWAAALTRVPHSCPRTLHKAEDFVT